MGLPRKVHAAGTASGAIEAAVRYRALSVDHIESASLRDADLLAGSSTIATLLPGGGAGGKEFAPARMLIIAVRQSRWPAISARTANPPGVCRA